MTYIGKTPPPIGVTEIEKQKIIDYYMDRYGTIEKIIFIKKISSFTTERNYPVYCCSFNFVGWKNRTFNTKCSIINNYMPVRLKKLNQILND